MQTDMETRLSDIEGIDTTNTMMTAKSEGGEVLLRRKDLKMAKMVWMY